MSTEITSYLISNAFYSFYKYLLNTYKVLSTVVSTCDRSQNKADKTLLPWALGIILPTRMKLFWGQGPNHFIFPISHSALYIANAQLITVSDLDNLLCKYVPNP